MNCRFQIVDCGLLREGRADYGKGRDNELQISDCRLRIVKRRESGLWRELK